MKKYILPIGALLLMGTIKAQVQLPSGLTGTNENYIYTRTYLEAKTQSDANARQVQAVQYFDGLGRPKQVVNIKASPLGKDIVTPIEYDPFGRQVKDYLPVPQGSTSNGAIIPNPLGNVTSVYGSEKIYSEKILENSPLDRIQQQIQVGTDWTNKPVKFDYDTNLFNEVYKYVTVTTWEDGATKSTLSLSPEGTYAPNQLYKTTVTDEDGNKTVEFKNGQGQILLVRKVNGSIEVDTYYVYNEYNQLAFVISPNAVHKAVTDTLLNDLCYQYRYDGRGRLVEKKLPGKGREYMVYDKADRLILTQDAVMATKNKWLMTKYDQFGRVAYTGTFSSNDSRNTLQNQIKDLVIYDLRDSTGFVRNGINIYYTAVYFIPENILSVNYYDTYPTYSFNPAFPVNTPEMTVLTGTLTADGRSTKGLPVMSLVKNIEDDSWTKNYTYYDQKTRPIASHSINHLGGYTRTESQLDFSGTPKMSVTKHKRLNTDTERVLTETFEYDNQNRLLVHKHQVDSNPVEYLTQNKYNELSQLESKKVGGIAAASPLQQIDYKYNIRGWMTQINDLSNLGSDLFGYKINYNKVEGLEVPNADYPSQKVKPKFNGNIAEVSWKTLTDSNGNLRRYGYVYDGLNRLTAGFYQKDTNASAQEYNELMAYDLNGNILNLVRTQGVLPGSETALVIDNLIYSYTGNKLNKVSDAYLNNTGYPIGGNEISYDDNGSMTVHPDKGISSIQYNYLNLPKQVTQNSTITNYIYRADGVKVKKSGIGISATDYLDGFQYTEGSLKFVPTSEGYFNFENNKYIYNYTDHLGNIRLSYFNNGSGIEVLEENNYYPFGLKHEGYNGLAGNPSYNYKYNGKELQESGMYDYGARFYMPDLGRWGVVDPLAEMYQPMSTYHMSGNNPIMFVDSNGMNYDDYGVDQNGNVSLIQKTDDNFDRLYKAKSDSNGNAVKDSNGLAQKATSGEGKEGVDYAKVYKPNKESSSLISSLSTQSTSDKNFGFDKINYARTNNAGDAANVFMFAAKNSNVEWGLDAYNVKGNPLYTVYTGHIEDLTPPTFQNQSMSKLLFEIHSHKNRNEPSPNNGATSGDYGVARDGDRIFYNRTKSNNYPGHYLYYAPTKGQSTLWKYYWHNNSKVKVGSSINLKLMK